MTKKKDTEIKEVKEDPSKAVVVIEDTGMEMMSATRMTAWYKQFVKFSKEILKENLDYGTIPGTNKPSLYKPGAEKLRVAYQLGVELKCIDKTESFTEPCILDYTYKAIIRSKSGQGLAECDGNCNSQETRYKYTWIPVPDKDKPSEEQRNILKAKKEGKMMLKGTNWIWHKRQEATEIAGLKNTIMKMSQKRAFVGAILMATGASEFFTQDLEDMDLDLTGSNTTKPPASGLTPVKKAKPIVFEEAKTAQATTTTKEAVVTAKKEDKKTTTTAKPAPVEAPKAEKTDTKVPVEDPTGIVLGEGDKNLTDDHRKALAEGKALIDAFKSAKEIAERAEVIAFDVMMNNSMKAEQVKPLKDYINKKWHWLKANPINPGLTV